MLDAPGAAGAVRGAAAAERRPGLAGTHGGAAAAGAAAVVAMAREDITGRSVGWWERSYVYNIYIYLIYTYIYIYCDRTPPGFPTTCNMFWYKDFLCCFFRFHFVRISSDFSSGALWQNVLPQDFATNSFVRISLGFRQNLN